MEDEGVRGHVLKRARPRRADHLNRVCPAVEQERPFGRWRADVVARWEGRGETLWFELKLGPGLTRAQRKLLRRRRAIIVHPRGKAPPNLKGLVHITWSELAKAARDPVLRNLLAQADASSSWWQEELTEPVLQEDFEGLMRGEAWERMYCFLATVDAHLSASEVLQEYRPSKAKAMTRVGSVPYYGYAFNVGAVRRSWYWIGFVRDGGKLCARLTWNPDGHEVLTVRKFPLKARTIADKIIAHLRAGPRL